MLKTWATRCIKQGGSAAVLVPKEVREVMGLRPGDMVVMRLFGKILIARRFDAKDVIDTDQVPADALPSAVRA